MPVPAFSTLISASSLADILGRGDVCVIDCRFDLLEPEAGRRQWLESHIPGAVYADLDKDLAGPVGAGSGRHPLPEPRQFAELLGQWGVDNGTDVVVYDSGGGAIAARAWWMLHWLGHGRARVLDGGLRSWLDAGNATESGPVTRKGARFVARPRDDMIISTPEIAAGLASGRAVPLLDAREAARFRGEIEPIDRVAGHIPGAISLPFAGNLTATGRLESPEALARRFEAALPAGSPRGWAVMCGSGVTACHLALAAVHAGLEMPRLYVGSWSEWISDPGRPVESGG